MRTFRRPLSLLAGSFCFWLVSVVLIPATRAEDTANAEDRAQRIGSHLSAAQVDRGLCCMLGFDAEVALHLVRSHAFLLNIRDADPTTVTRVRRIADEAGYDIDRVLVQKRVTPQLPYADNLIDALLATQVTDQQLDDLDVSEVLRVLRPEGLALIGRACGDEERSDLTQTLRRWAGDRAAEVLELPSAVLLSLRKPAVEGVDEWRHWEHGPDNNPVSSDSVIQAPYMTQFLSGPFYIAMPSITTVAGGRTFLATGHIAHHRREWEMVNRLIARNGYNGTVLWERKLPEGFLAHRSAFIATKDVFYLLDGDGCLALDAATGQERGRIEIPGVAGEWKWMVLDQGILYVMTGPAGGDAEVIKGDRTFGGWSWADLSRGYYSRPRVPWGFGHTVAAYDLKQERLVWRHDEQDLIDSRGMAMLDDKIYLYCPEKQLRCIRRSTGEDYWTTTDPELLRLIEQPGRGLVSTPGFRSACLTVATPEALIIQGQTRMNVVAVSTHDGSLLWSKKKFTNNPNAVYLDGELVLGVGTGGNHAVLDPVSGEIRKELPFRKAACTRLTACPDSLFVRGEGTLRFDRESGKVLVDGAVRPACLDGAIPANGLLYLGPWACDCNLSLIGAMAKCSAGDAISDDRGRVLQRLETGQGDVLAVAALTVDQDDWPTYRGDVARSASTAARLANPQPQDGAAPAPRWIYTPPRGAVPTPPVTAGGFVFVAGSDGKVRAIDARNGRLSWEFATGGPIKACPTVWDGRLFVGSGDGWVYALEAASGRMLWRFHPAPQQRMIMVYGNLCSTWPVNTGVLVHEGIAYFAAGIVDYDGTYVCALDARTGEIRWENTTCGHLNPELRKGVSAQGNLTIQGDRLLMAGGNQASPAAFDLATGECLNASFPQGQPKANHGRFVGLLNDDYPLLGGRILYASPRNVANKDSFVVLRDGRPLTMNFGGVPPAWNSDLIALADFRNGRLQCCGMEPTVTRIQQGLGTDARGDAPGGRWASLAQALAGGEALLWTSDLNNPNKFEVLALAVTPDRVAAIVQFQNRVRAHPQWQAIAFESSNGTPIWFWRHDLPAEPLPEGLAVGRFGQMLVTLLDGQVLSLSPNSPRPAGAVRD